MSYLLITAARNEETRLPRLIESVRAQTITPQGWWIVSDGSTDATDAIIQAAAAEAPWIHAVRIDRRVKASQTAARVSPGKVASLNEAWSRARELRPDFLGVLDADIELPTDYYARVLEMFRRDERLGLAGGGVYNVFPDGRRAPGGFIQPHFVGGPVQMFRRETWEAIGGYVAYGHEDVIANAAVRLAGWRVRCEPEIEALHHDQPRLGWRDKIPSLFRVGAADYIMRTSLHFELIRAGRRMLAPPHLVAGLAQLLGYLSAYLASRPRIPASSRLQRYLHWEEGHKLRRVLGLGRKASE